MNLIILAGFGVGVLMLLWTVQALALLATGDRHIFVFPYHHGNKSQIVRWAMKVALQIGLLSILFLYPCAIGKNPWEYHAEKFVPASWQPIIEGLALALGLLGIPLAINFALGWVRFAPQFHGWRLAYKIGKSFLIPIPLTLVEEPLFRGIVQEQFLQGLSPGVIGQVAALVLGAMLFASVHFIRPHKAIFLPAAGLFGLGLILGVAYISTGHHYLLPIALHAGGVWFIQAHRPIIEYRGPAWWIGYSTYPICGVLGLSMMIPLEVVLISGVL
ncbi:MAG: CPBP family intramembrane metalloprotease [Planctomycetes bacterium]|nr:CPBP family intramembrane metalloprotease [Planctomycetota bacterium]